MAKDITYGQEAREKIWAGIDAVSRAVEKTLSPKGREVLITQDAGAPVIVKNGAAIVRSAKSDDPYENMGIQVMKDMARVIQDSAGDGVSAAVVLLNYILQEGMKNIAAGANPIELRKGIQGAVQLSCAAINKMSRPVKSAEDIRCVCAVSAGDALAGELVSRALEKIGAEGILSVEETPNTDTTLEITEGMEYEKGYLQAELLKNPGRMCEELDNPYILVTDYEISGSQDILPVLELVRAKGRPLLLIAESITGTALTTLILNKRQGIVDVTAVHPPAYGDGRRERMEDIAIYTGGVFITEELGYNIRNIKPEMLGSADKVIITKNNTSIIGRNGCESKIREHVAGLRQLIAAEDYGFKKERMRERLARFSGGTAIIKAGASTETEMKELKHRLENAVQAAKAAMAEGIVPGGGTTYLDILPAVRAYAATLEGDRRTGAFILLRALEIPARQIAENCGKDASVVAAKTKASERGVGYDAKRDAHVDMMAAGIVDSAKAIRIALQCAASAASTLLTAEAGVVMKEEKCSNKEQ